MLNVVTEYHLCTVTTKNILLVKSAGNLQDLMADNNTLIVACDRQACKVFGMYHKMHGGHGP